MDDAELEALLTDLESDRAERKEALTSASARESVAKAICAFANDLPDNRTPGVVIVGVRDDGTCAGRVITEEVLQTLSAMRSDGRILPPPSLVVQKRTIAGCEVAITLVHPVAAPPVRFAGRVYVRAGPSTVVATAEDERRLAEKRRFHDLPFELHSVSYAALEDLDLDGFSSSYLPHAVAPEVLAENARTPIEQLASLRFADLDPPHPPTVLGLLVVGHDPRRFVGGAYVQFLRIDGTELTDNIQDNQEISGGLVSSMHRLDDLLRAHIRTAVNITARDTDIRTPDYPIPALQQVVRNAALHRNYEGTNAPTRITWYSDRVEVLSPGGPFGQVTRENFGQPGIADYRNRHLAEAMKTLGFIQQFGVGIAIARREMEKNGNPPPEFTVTDTHVLCVLRARP